LCRAQDCLQIFCDVKGAARYFRVRHRDATTKKFFYHSQSKGYAEKELVTEKLYLKQKYLIAARVYLT